MDNIDFELQYQILKVLESSFPVPTFRFSISGVTDVILMDNLKDLIQKGLVSGKVETVGYDLNKMRPAPFLLTEYGAERFSNWSES